MWFDVGPGFFYTRIDFLEVCEVTVDWELCLQKWPSSINESMSGFCPHIWPIHKPPDKRVRVWRSSLGSWWCLTKKLSCSLLGILLNATLNLKKKSYQVMFHLARNWRTPCPWTQRLNVSLSHRDQITRQSHLY